jgi:hypothetical protein
LTAAVAAARAGYQSAREKQRDAEALARQKEAALTGEQAKHQAARQTLLDLEVRFSELQASVAEGEKSLRRALGRRAPRGGAVIETWIETQVASLARSRKADEEAKTRLATAERTLERARADETAARDRLSEREASRKRLEEERSASLQRLATLEAEIRAVTEAPDPEAEAASLEEQIQQLEAN